MHPCKGKERYDPEKEDKRSFMHHDFRCVLPGALKKKEVENILSCKEIKNTDTRDMFLVYLRFINEIFYEQVING